MEEERFNRLVKLDKGIQHIKENIQKINSLLEGCSIECTVEGTKRGTLMIKTSVRIFNDKVIKGLLLTTKEDLLDQLSELRK